MEVGWGLGLMSSNDERAGEHSDQAKTEYCCSIMHHKSTLPPRMIHGLPNAQ